MNIYWWFVVIFAAALAVMVGAALLLERGGDELERIRLTAELERAGNVVRLPVAGCFELVESYRPAPPVRADRAGPARGPSGFDTGPLWIVSETLAAGDQFARENPWLWEDAARRIGPVQP